MTTTIKATLLSATLVLAMGQSAFAVAHNDPCIAGKLDAEMALFCKRTGKHEVRCHTSPDGPMGHFTGKTVPGVCDVKPGDRLFAKAQKLCAEFCGAGLNAGVPPRGMSDEELKQAADANAMVASPDFRKCKVKAMGRQAKNLAPREALERATMVCQFLYSQNLIYNQIIPAYLGDQLDVIGVDNGFKLVFHNDAEMKAYEEAMRAHTEASDAKLVEKLYEKVQNLLGRHASEKEMVDSLSPAEVAWLKSKGPYSGKNDKEHLILSIIPFAPLLKPIREDSQGGWGYGD